jgi:hypothetical protein
MEDSSRAPLLTIRSMIRLVSQPAILAKVIKAFYNVIGALCDAYNTSHNIFFIFLIADMAT